nr:MAG TPA: hypothetical protein [Caudoviricetes sp.]
MTMFQQMGKLISVTGIHGDLQFVRGLRCILRSPTFLICPGSCRRTCLNLCFHSFRSFLHSSLYTICGRIGILIQFLHDGICHISDGYLRCHNYRLTFCTQNFSDFRLLF